MKTFGFSLPLARPRNVPPFLAALAHALFPVRRRRRLRRSTLRVSDAARPSAGQHPGADPVHLGTLEEVLDVVLQACVSRPLEVVEERTPESAHRTIVGIAGSPGAGKTTIGELLVERLGAGAQLVSMDGFHLAQTRLVELGRRDRMGAPDTFDVAGFVELLASLRFSAESVAAPGFDRVTEEAVPGAVRVAPDTRVVVVEGNYLLHDDGGWESVAPLLDVSLFVAVGREIRLARLVERHERFGKSGPDARAWALGPDEANARLVEATSSRADYILHLGPLG
ncbi:MAG TPA: nucleoside/nucleotide kinase family protein [Marisediminicola sp.]|nr:nucleoside/nucleotide kinase family protein [Marisediminicola sp.]